jgi:putative transposase
MAYGRDSLGQPAKQLQEENARLKRLVAELSLDKTMLQDVLAKKL